MEGQILCYARFQDASSQVLSSAIKCYHLCFSFSFTLRCCAWLGSPPENLRGGCGRIHCGPVSWSKAHETNETVFKTCSLSTKRLQVAQVVLESTSPGVYENSQAFQLGLRLSECIGLWRGLNALHNSTSDTRYPRSFFSLCQTHNSLA